MERRSFLTLAAMCAGSSLFGMTEEMVFSKNDRFDNPIVSGLLDKLETVQNYVGYVRFNTMSFDEMLKTAVYCKKPLSRTETGYIEYIFYGDPKRYGFYGERTVSSITDSVPKKDLIYIKGTGHSLIRGAATEKYATIKKLIGDDVVLTSGVRAPVKQLYLFLKKMEIANGDLRITSTSIAPPGFTFHSIGDFDIGKTGFGQANFTERFQETDVFKKLYDGGFITIRYTSDNPFGVRYEPWHIKVTEGSETA
ncbi:MAG: D-alanyl-D-alanine carboxypeptidase family protein [Sulfuricurvum sp.]